MFPEERDGQEKPKNNFSGENQIWSSFSETIDRFVRLLQSNDLVVDFLFRDCPTVCGIEVTRETSQRIRVKDCCST
jgi:hypothetical protein